MVAAAAGVERPVFQAHEAEVIVLRAAWLQGAHQIDIVVPVGEVVVEEARWGCCAAPVVRIDEIRGKLSRHDFAVGLLCV